MVLDPRRQSFGIWFFFHVKFHKILHQISPYFQILGHFWQSNEYLFPEISKKPFFLVPFQVCKFPLKSCLKKPAFLSTKIEYLRNRLVKFKKWAHSDILSLRAFKWCKNQIILKKFQFWLTTLLKETHTLIWQACIYFYRDKL